MDSFLTLAQCAEICGGRSKQWARRHLIGAIPHYRFSGSGALFKKTDFEAWLEHHRREPVNADAVFAALVGPRAVRKGGK